MEITVKVFGLEDSVNTSTVLLELPEDASVGDMIEELVARYGDSLRQKLLKKGHLLQDGVHVVLGEEIVDRLERRLAGQSRAFILRQIQGGAPL